MKIFISYSYKDEDYKKELDTHLSSLKRQGKIKLWEDRQIDAGENWNKAIFNNLESAEIILLIVRANFINSEFCYSKEMKRAIKRTKTGEALTIPIIVKP